MIQRNRASGGRSGDEISDMVAVIPDDIELRADMPNPETDMVHIIGSDEEEDNFIPSYAHPFEGHTTNGEDSDFQYPFPSVQS